MAYPSLSLPNLTLLRIESAGEDAQEDSWPAAGCLFKIAAFKISTFKIATLLRHLRLNDGGKNPRRLVEHVEQGTMDLQLVSVVITDEALRPELIEEETDSRPGCAHHLPQGFLTNPGNNSVGLAWLAEMSQQ